MAQGDAQARAKVLALQSAKRGADVDADDMPLASLAAKEASAGAGSSGDGAEKQAACARAEEAPEAEKPSDPPPGGFGEPPRAEKQKPKPREGPNQHLCTYKTIRNHTVH